MHNFTNLQIWQKGIDLAQIVYALSDELPKNEKYGIISQIQRAAVSIPSNIAEGAGRATDKEFTHFLSIAIGSSFELYTQIILLERIGYIDKNKISNLINMIVELQKMLIGYKRKIDSKLNSN
ncbi:MAG: four helix bundle protein [Paludibacteraceae bacterium]|nr:four helix bundle protein [Paludibacteraceae bacterium]